MICPACGKEVPDDALFCGYCGTSLTKEKAEKPVPVEPEVTDAKASEHMEDRDKAEENPSPQGTNTEAEPAKPESAEETASDETSSLSEKPEDNVSEEKTEEEKPAGEEESDHSASEEKAAEEKKKPFAKIRKKNEAVEKGKKTVSQINWSEFRVYADIIRNPFEEHEIADVPLITGIVIVLLGNWYVFGSFANGLMVLAFLMAGSMIVQYISGRNGGQYHASRAFRNAFTMTAAPFLAILAAGIALRTTGGDVTLIARRLGLIVALAIFAAVSVTMTLIHEAEGISRWLLVLILTAMLACITYYLSAQYVAQIASLLGAY